MRTRNVDFLVPLSWTFFFFNSFVFNILFLSLWFCIEFFFSLRWIVFASGWIFYSPQLYYVIFLCTADVAQIKTKKLSKFRFQLSKCVLGILLLLWYISFFIYIYYSRAQSNLSVSKLPMNWCRGMKMCTSNQIYLHDGMNYQRRRIRNFASSLVSYFSLMMTTSEHSHLSLQIASGHITAFNNQLLQMWLK